MYTLLDGLARNASRWTRPRRSISRSSNPVADIVFQWQELSAVTSCSSQGPDPAATGEFSAQRFQDSIGKEVPLVTYSFCVVTTATECEEGYGTVPDSDFLGKITPDPEGGTTFTPEHLTLPVNTTAAGFSNTMCIAPNDRQQTCPGGTEMAPGGRMAFVIDKTGVGNTDVNKDGSRTLYSAPNQHLRI